MEFVGSRCGRGRFGAAVMNCEHCLSPARVSGERCNDLGNGLAYAGTLGRIPPVPGAGLLRTLREAKRDARDEDCYLALLRLCGRLLDMAACFCP